MLSKPEHSLTLSAQLRAGGIPMLLERQPWFMRLLVVSAKQVSGGAENMAGKENLYFGRMP
jgi:hypothetical protein